MGQIQSSSGDTTSFFFHIDGYERARKVLAPLAILVPDLLFLLGLTALA
jgi:hypothetical protein